MTKRTGQAEDELEQLPEGLEAPDPEGTGGLPDEPSAIELAVLAAIETARVRRDPLRQVRWLLEFERVAISDLDKQARAKLCRQARDRFVPGFRTPEQKDIEGAQRLLKDGLNSLRREEPWEFELGAKPKAVMLPPPRGQMDHGEGGAQLIWRPARWFHERFLMAAMRALDAAGDGLRLCKTPGCPKLFLATTRQARCREHAAEAHKAQLVAFTDKRREDRRLAREARDRRRASLTMRSKGRGR